LGNPPYGAALSEAEKEYLQGHYVYTKGKPESYCFFLERGVQLLTPNGLLGFITPNAWLTNYCGVQIRELMLKQTRLLDLVDLEPTKVFKNAVVDTAIVVAQKSDSIGAHEAQVWTGTKDFKIVPKFKTAQAEWLEDPDRLTGQRLIAYQRDSLPHLLHVPFKTRPRLWRRVVGGAQEQIL